MTAEALIGRLDGVRNTGPGRWLARCPAHDDRRPSLGVRELEDGKILVHCFAQCSPCAVVSAVGLTMADLMPRRPRDTSDDPGGCLGLRRPWAAEDVVRAVAHEALINQKDEAVLELGGRPENLFLLLVIAAETAYQRNPDAFGTVEDIRGHKFRVAELEAKRKELYGRFPNTWGHNDLHIGRITSDGAALITFAKAAGEVPVHPPETAGERLVEYLLRQEVAKAA